MVKKKDKYKQEFIKQIFYVWKYIKQTHSSHVKMTLYKKKQCSNKINDALLQHYEF